MFRPTLLLSLLLITLITLTQAAPISIPLPGPSEDYHELVLGEFHGDGRGWVPTTTVVVHGAVQTGSSGLTSTPLPALLRRLVPFLQFPPSSMGASSLVPADVLRAGLIEEAAYNPAPEESETGEIKSSVRRREMKRLVQRAEEDWGAVDAEVGRPTGADVVA